jgi:hypothetical protein
MGSIPVAGAKKHRKHFCARGAFFYSLQESFRVKQKMQSKKISTKRR